MAHHDSYMNLLCDQSCVFLLADALAIASIGFGFLFRYDHSCSLLPASTPSPKCWIALNVCPLYLFPLRHVRFFALSWCFINQKCLLFDLLSQYKTCFKQEDHYFKWVTFSWEDILQRVRDDSKTETNQPLMGIHKQLSYWHLVTEAEHKDQFDEIFFFWLFDLLSWWQPWCASVYWSEIEAFMPQLCNIVYPFINSA